MRALSRIYEYFYNRYQGDRAYDHWGVGRRTKEPTGARNSTGPYKLLSGDIPHATNATLMHDMSLVFTGMPQIERIVLLIANFLGLLEEEGGELAVFLYYLLLTPEEREQMVATQLTARGASKEAMAGRVGAKASRLLAPLNDPILTTFVAVATDRVAAPKRDDAEEDDPAPRRERFASYRDELLMNLIARIEWDIRDQSLLLEWTEEARLLLRHWRLPLAHPQGAFQIDERGVRLRPALAGAQNGVASCLP